MPAGRADEIASPENVHRLAVLRDLYEGLLPPRQREVIGMKLDEDLSLAEMAERLGVSRQACEDALKRAERTLLAAERRLGFSKRAAGEMLCVERAEAALAQMNESNWSQARALALEWLKAFREGGEQDRGI